MNNREGQEKSTPHDLRNCPAMRALEYLTPGGSEYVDDIPRCIATVRESHSMVMRQLVKVTKELHALRSVAGGEPEQWLEVQQETDGRWIAEWMHVPGCIAYGENRLSAVTKATVLLEKIGTK